MFLEFIPILLQYIIIEIVVTIITIYNVYSIWFSELKNPDKRDNFYMTLLWGFAWIIITIVIIILLGFPPS